LAAAGVPRHRITVLPAFSRALLGARVPPTALAAFRAAHEPLFAAALAPGATYGADVLLPAFEAARARLPGSGLVIFGPGTAAPGFVAPGVLALGEISHGEALATIEAADVFVRPTRADGDAVSVREALALGRAVVATSVGHRPAGCLLVPPADRDALAARLVEAGSEARRGGAIASGRREPGSAGGGAKSTDEQDPFEVILALYGSLGTAGPLPDDGRRPVRAPTL
ncbi:MAG TPA: glycosyltransferase, partial [Anaeromyxobacteraceae bacterium]|nr:glycosyltransferase [Anaeromyxobacteraceae bacterium]